MSKKERYSHLGSDTDETGGTNDQAVETRTTPEDDSVRITVSDGSGDIHLHIDESVSKEELINAIREYADDDDEDGAGSEMTRSPWVHGMRASTHATRSMLIAGTFGMRIGTLGAGSMLCRRR